MSSRKSNDKIQKIVFIIPELGQKCQKPNILVK